jgi:hypothetical protein
MTQIATLDVPSCAGARQQLHVEHPRHAGVEAELAPQADSAIQYVACTVSRPA